MSPKDKEQRLKEVYHNLKTMVAAHPGIHIEEVEQLLRTDYRYSLDEIVGALDHGLANDNRMTKRLGESEMVFQVDRSGPSGQRIGRRLFLRQDAPGPEMNVMVSAFKVEGADDLVATTVSLYQRKERIDLRGSSDAGAIELLSKLLGRKINIDSLPTEPGR
ncbi:MAG: hypothetical protein M1484_03860 [Patescibacteria group bacterium]|nr:hypothetical protein [Patescibacteria group bacterium]MCL5432197.1 hypothetical protein [Patescibacteria group bacterium]